MCVCVGIGVLSVCMCGYRCVECVHVCVCVCVCVCFPLSLTLSPVLSNQKFMLPRTETLCFSIWH